MSGTVVSNPVIDKYQDKLVSAVRIMQHGNHPVALNVKSSVGDNVINRNYSGALFLNNDEECRRVVDILL